MSNATNYRSLATCASIGENLAVSLPIEDGLVRIPMLSSHEVNLHLGGDASFAQRLAFEWGLLGTISRRNGDEVTAAYCAKRRLALAESL